MVMSAILRGWFYHIFSQVCFYLFDTFLKNSWLFVSFLPFCQIFVPNYPPSSGYSLITYFDLDIAVFDPSHLEILEILTLTLLIMILNICSWVYGSSLVILIKKLNFLTWLSSTYLLFQHL